MHLGVLKHRVPMVPACVLLSLALSSFSWRVKAHEFWLSPSSHGVSVGISVDVYAMIGHGEKAEALVRRRDHLKTFLVHEGKQSEELSGRNLRHPTGKFRPMGEGLHIVAYESLAQINSLPGKEFEDYLQKEGLDEVLDSRRLAKESEAPGREAYYRFAKCLIQVGDKTGADCSLGFPLEIVTLTDPARMSVGTTLVVRVLREGEPIPGLLVKAFSLASVSEPRGVRTDFDGLARINIDRAGRWMLNAVSMEPSEDSSEADWQSYWASLTFEVPEPNAAPTP
ncbi:DUF4198 domain-containing protein [Verrucomicrobia bacterium]|jgi:uncharacterized GH25 family protein|nr:DUF4198 domain-containing protein [Verrucomicrobiota bacterium]MDA7510295.1 DUF4198 domain-containing protein [Verrucomicrobiota bacterium]MDA7866893.1 DUF4198 domain-containing protein [Verrucomicrobiota bacterium]